MDEMWENGLASNNKFFYFIKYLNNFNCSRILLKDQEGSKTNVEVT